jgi:hypothetical protein
VWGSSRIRISCRANFKTGTTDCRWSCVSAELGTIGGDVAGRIPARIWVKGRMLSGINSKLKRYNISSCLKQFLTRELRKITHLHNHILNDRLCRGQNQLSVSTRVLKNSWECSKITSEKKRNVQKVAWIWFLRKNWIRFQPKSDNNNSFSDTREKC